MGINHSVSISQSQLQIYSTEISNELWTTNEWKKSVSLLLFVIVINHWLYEYKRLIPILKLKDFANIEKMIMLKYNAFGNL